MLIGLLKEVKDIESRVRLTPESVKKLISQGHEILVETDAGFGSGFSDYDYINLGARIVKKPKEVASDLVIDFVEPNLKLIYLAPDRNMIRWSF